MRSILLYKKSKQKQNIFKIIKGKQEKEEMNIHVHRELPCKDYAGTPMLPGGWPHSVIHKP